MQQIMSSNINPKVYYDTSIKKKQCTQGINASGKVFCFCFLHFNLYRMTIKSTILLLKINNRIYSAKEKNKNKKEQDSIAIRDAPLKAYFEIHHTSSKKFNVFKIKKNKKVKIYDYMNIYLYFTTIYFNLANALKQKENK